MSIDWVWCMIHVLNLLVLRFLLPGLQIPSAIAIPIIKSLDGLGIISLMHH